MYTFTILLLGLAAVSAAPNSRIVGGSLTTISQWPETASLLYSATTSGHRHTCGGTILNRRAILTAAWCVHGSGNGRWRSRVGATNANSGGTVVNTAGIIVNPHYHPLTRDSDLAIIRTSSNLPSNNNVRNAAIPGPYYSLLDNTQVIATGWGRTAQNGIASEQLRYVQIWTVNQNICRQRYNQVNQVITDNMLCTGWLDVGGRDQCAGDEGGPVYHLSHNQLVVVGVTSWGRGCATPQFPSVNVRLSRYTNWITTNSA